MNNLPTININEYEKRLLCGLRDLSDNIRKQCDSSLKDMFGQSWVEQMDSEISQFCKQNRNIKPTPPFHSPESAFFLIFFRDKDRLLELDRIVHEVDEVTKKKRVFRNKLNQLRNKHSSAVMGVLLELFSCGKFLIDLKLKDIDVKVRPESGSNVDAMIKIDERKILVEVTLVSESFLQVIPGMTCALDTHKIKKQIENKILEKTKSGKQLGIATGPTILIIGLPPIDIYTKTAESLIKELFNTGECGISAIIINPGFLFEKGCIFYNPNANYPILRSEQNGLTPMNCTDQSDVIRVL